MWRIHQRKNLLVSSISPNDNVMNLQSTHPLITPDYSAMVPRTAVDFFPCCGAIAFFSLLPIKRQRVEDSKSCSLSQQSRRTIPGGRKRETPRLYPTVYKLLRNFVPAGRINRTCQNNGRFSETNQTAISSYRRLRIPGPYFNSAEKGCGLGQKREVYVLHRATFTRSANGYGN